MNKNGMEPVILMNTPKMGRYFAHTVYGMGNEKVPVFCKTAIMRQKFCVPFPCPFCLTYFRVNYLLRE